MEAYKRIIGLLIIITISYVGGFFTKQRLDSSTVIEYQNTITQFEERYNELSESYNRVRESNSTLTDRNNQLIEQLDSAKGRAERAEGVIGQISVGLSKSNGDIQSIIEAIDAVITAVRGYEVLE